MRGIYQMKPGHFGLLFLLALFIEIAGFIIVGDHIGVLPTIGLIILSMVLGFVLLRFQSFSLLRSMQNELAAGHVPDSTMAQGSLTLLGAILLIIPGFVSDMIGLLLFVPFIRTIVWNFFSRRVAAKATFYEKTSSHRTTDTTIIDLDPEDYTAKHPENSPWRNENDQKRIE